MLTDKYARITEKSLMNWGSIRVGENIYNLYMIGFISYWKIFSQI